ncbi:protein of unknown function [Tindallia magadiensis]|uniref:G5 domain-containing protein n=1 Tax=Tindallia magadiensis TaxID=69895 RepID=A0A1I3CXB2_9FIRM|nr:3D domain-containing protein [Tindallia magadiensis]SFH79190.1 protein of unknown function [Tindallia magadiensis]
MKELKWMLIPLLITMMVTTAFVHPDMREVTIKAGEQTLVVESRKHTVEEVLAEANIQISSQKQVSPALEEKTTNGMTIKVKDVFPVTLEVDGEKHRIYTAEPHVKALLDQVEVVLEKDDLIHPAPMNRLKPEMEIRITRVKTEPDNDVEEIPYQVLTKYTADLEPGETRVVQEGSPGRQILQKTLVYHDGTLSGFTVDERHILEEAQDKIIEKGKENVLITDSGELLHYKKVYTMEATAYDAGYQSTGKHPGHPQYGITRSGTRVRPGVVAVDPNVIPLGTKLYVESVNGGSNYGISSAEDTGGAIKGKRIDLYYESRSEALRFGRQPVKVYVLE